MEHKGYRNASFGRARSAGLCLSGARLEVRREHADRVEKYQLFL
jgi:hypothetical protein